MRIVLSGFRGEGKFPDVKIFTDSGLDITRDLGLCQIDITVSASQLPTAVLHCEIWGGMEADVEEERISVLVRKTEEEKD